MPSPAPSRRDFVKSAAAALPAPALLARGAADRVVMAVIGVGGMGSGHLGGLVKRADADNVRVAAVCDVYRRRLARARSASGAEGDPDYRRILDRKDIDAV